MAKNENVSRIDRKGKPVGNGRENETLTEAAGEANDVQNLDISELDIQHPNRHLHKGEEVKTFKDHEVLILAAVCCEAAYTLIGKALTKNYPPEEISGLSALIAVICFIPFCLWQSPPTAHMQR